MKNLFYAAIVIGIIALAVGIYFLVANHPARGYVGIAVGALLLIAGVVGAVMGRPRAV